MDHKAYVAKVRKQLAAVDRDAPDDHGITMRSMLTGNAYYTARFDQVWLQVHIKFGDGTDTTVWAAIMPSEDRYDLYHGLVMTPDDTTEDIDKGWYVPVASGGQGN